MNEDELKHRTKGFALEIIGLVGSLPGTAAARTIGSQLIRSGTSVGANYRSACCGRSKPDFISKAGIALEEADESLYWMELLVESGIVASERVRELMNEANELVAIFTASIKTARVRSGA